MTNAGHSRYPPGRRLRGDRPGAYWEVDFTEVKPAKYGNKYLLGFFLIFNIFYYVFSSITFPMLSQKSPTPSPQTLPPTPLPTHSHFLALAFPCTGAYTVCVSNGPLFPVMAD